MPLSPERIAMNDVLVAAQREVTTATQKVNDALTAYRLMGWGKIEKAAWDYDYESDDQGGNYVSLTSAQLVIGGMSYSLGYDFEALLANGDEVEEGSQVEALMQKYKLAGIQDEVEAFKHALAELAELSFEDFEDFLALLDALVHDDKTAGEIKFTH